MSRVTQWLRTAGVGRGARYRRENHRRAFWTAEDEMAFPVVASPGVVQMASRARPTIVEPTVGGDRVNARFSHGVAMRQSSRLHYRWSKLLLLCGAREPSYHIANKQYRYDCRFSFFKLSSVL